MQDAYFKDLQTQLKKHGNGQPQLLLDLNRIESNIIAIRSRFLSHLKPRLVVKSLANLDLIKHVATAFNTTAFMVFHLPHIARLFQTYPQADILMGKPMPTQAFQYYLAKDAQGLSQIQWLIDSIARLMQYLELARQCRCRILVNLEIDVGLHRGGFSDLNEFEQALRLIQNNAQYLQLSGLMGYDAHIAKLPKALFTPVKTYQASQQRYQQFIRIIEQIYPDVDIAKLTFNGAGSGTLHHHLIQSVCNDVSFGSMLLKPSDFDLEGLIHLQPALWIATPILKKLDQIQVPGFEKLNKLQPKQRGICIYGGYWRGEYVYPKGTKPHLLYGRSSNQEVLQVVKDEHVDVGDYVFLRPAQSESILPQFAQLQAFQKDQWMVWENLRE